MANGLVRREKPMLNISNQCNEIKSQDVQFFLSFFFHISLNVSYAKRKFGYLYSYSDERFHLQGKMHM